MTLPVVLQSGERSFTRWRQQDDDDAVVVEIGLAAEGGGVDGIEVGVEERADVVELGLGEAARGASSST